MSNRPHHRSTARKFLLAAAAGGLVLSAAGCVTEPGPAGTAATATPTAQPPRTARPIRFGGPCRQINIGTPENPRFVRDPACGSGASN